MRKKIPITIMNPHCGREGEMSFWTGKNTGTNGA